MAKCWTLGAFKVLKAPSFQNLESKFSLSNFCQRFHSFQNFASDKLSKIWNLIAGNFFPAICFQSFESKSLETIRQLAFKFLKARSRIFSSDLLSKLWKQIAGKNLPASFQIFESYLKAILRRENQDGRHQGNHRHNLLDKKYIFLEEMKYSIFVLFISNIYIGFAPCLRVGTRFYKLHESWYILWNSVREAWHTVTVWRFENWFTISEF